MPRPTSSTVNLANDVTYRPPVAWQQYADPGCSQSLSYSSSTQGASASLSFQGDTVQITGSQQSIDGILRISVDNHTSIVDLTSDSTTCATLYNWAGSPGFHELTLSIVPPSNNTSRPFNLTISEITYSTSHPPHGPTLGSAAIIGIVLGCFVVSLGAIILRCVIASRKPDPEVGAWMAGSEKERHSKHLNLESLSRTSSVTMVSVPPPTGPPPSRNAAPPMLNCPSIYYLPH
ncbi:hypothetical protein BXZ70DRAFT_1012560 [Cristinia sonorae]|uniref:Uncharacterized protein n=1 Tax=Cristinia sonorae TaxID=1940300 RepID=A0A8K0UGF0_9AGAR|nr:hypothetical protein BXZ70DRAFT_1012560 [Cristinia sonorae]